MKASEIIQNELDKGSFYHCYLFIGNDRESISKTIEKLIAKSGALKEDVSELISSGENKKSEIGVEETRQFLKDIYKTPHGKKRIAIIRNAEKLNQSSGNVLLKSLEEPPQNSIFVLVSSSPCVLPTIKSRCQIVNFYTKKMLYEETSFTRILNLDFSKADKEFDDIVKQEKTLEFLDEIEQYLRENMIGKMDEKYAGYLKEILRIRRQIYQNANPKLALEYAYLMMKES